jgi:uncharacterized protein (DUF2141 family)
MKNLLLGLAANILFVPPIAAASLRVKLSGVESSDGTLRYLLFAGKAGFPDDPGKSVRWGSVPGKTREFVLPDLPPGKYALTLLHDKNDNGKLDTKLGLPLEGFGFSENPKIFFGPPSFHDSRFRLDGAETITVRMKYY